MSIAAEHKATRDQAAAGNGNGSAGGGLLTDRRGIVLGVSSRDSVGFQCVESFRRQGATVGMCYREHANSRGPEIASALAIPAIGFNALETDSVATAIDTVATQLERLDFLVHTLVHVQEGVLSRPLLELSQQDFATALNVGVHSLLSAVRCALPWLARSNSPRVVALFSAGGEWVMPNYHIVGIVKAALAAALRYTAYEVGPKGVLCNGVSFSIVDTNGAQRAIGKDTISKSRDYITKRSMTRLPLEFEHVTDAVSFFASAHCRNATGEILSVDGGFSKTYF